jgi:hypothetical protein
MTVTVSALAHGPSHNRSTKYEVIVVINGAAKVAGYTARKTKKSLISVALDNDSIRSEILAALPADDNSTPAYNAREGWVLGNTVIRWSGGTACHPA